MTLKRIHIIISGRVQGVFFRHNIKKLALKLGITGWVKNTADRKVEAVAEGEEEKISQLLAFCKKGPLMASVEKVGQEVLSGEKEFDYFSIRF